MLPQIIITELRRTWTSHDEDKRYHMLVRMYHMVGGIIVGRLTWNSEDVLHCFDVHNLKKGERARANYLCDGVCIDAYSQQELFSPWVLQSTAAQLRPKHNARAPVQLNCSAICEYLAISRGRRTENGQVRERTNSISMSKRKRESKTVNHCDRSDIL